MSIHRRGKIYHGAFWVNGKEIWRSLRTDDKFIAQQRYEEKKESLKYPHRSSFDEFLTRYMDYCKTNHAVSTYSSRDKTTFQTFAKLTQIKYVNELSAGLIEQWKEARKKSGVKASTINRELGSIKAMVTKAQEWKFIPHEQLRSIKKLPENRAITRYFDQEAIEKIKMGCKDHKTKLRVYLAIYSGFRRSELMMIRWEDIDFKNNTIELCSRPGFSIKNYQEARIQMHPELKKVLLDAKKTANHELVLGKISKDCFSRWWKRFLRRCGLSGTLHSVRHTVATHIVQQLGIYQAKSLLRHASVKTTERYSHLSSELVPIKDGLKY